MGRKTEAAGAGREEPAVVVAIRMDKTTIIVSSVVGSLGVLSAILGFAAEAAKLGDCASALGRAVTASIFLMMAQVTVAAAGGCCGCCKSRAMPSEAKRIVGVVCAAISWVAAVVAFALFVDGSIGAAVACVGLVGEFAGAAVLVLLSTGLGITSFVMLRTQSPRPQPGEGGAAPAPRDGAEEPTPIGTPMDGPGQFRLPTPQNPQAPEPLPNHPPPAYSPAPAQGNAGGQAANQQLPPHPQGHAQV